MCVANHKSLVFTNFICESSKDSTKTGWIPMSLTCSPMGEVSNFYHPVYFAFIQTVSFISAVNQVLEKVGSSLSWFSVFIGLNGTSEELGLHAGNTFAFSG